MKLAVLSDIHSNYAALEACYEYIKQQNISGILYLGDYISDCPYPQRTMGLIREKAKEYPSWFIKGNREEYFINHHDNKNDGWKYSSGSGALLYTYENLTEDDIKFFRECRSTLKFELTGYPPITMCHGSPLSSRDCLFPGDDLTELCLKDLNTGYLLCGHTHRQLIYSSCGKTMINPGSVGIPTNGQTRPQFVVLHGEKGEWIPELISVEYDISKFLREFETSGLYDKAKMWARAVCKTLQTGIDYAPMCLQLAGRLASQEEDRYDPQEIPEKYWEEAARQLGIVQSVC